MKKTIKKLSDTELEVTDSETVLWTKGDLEAQIAKLERRAQPFRDMLKQFDK